MKKGVPLVGMTFTGDADNDPFEFAVNDGFMPTEGIGDESQFRPGNNGLTEIDQRNDKPPLMSADPGGVI